MSDQRLLHESGFTMFRQLAQAVRDGKQTLAQLGAASELWLRNRGYRPTSLGWWKADDLSKMGAQRMASGNYAIGVEERRRDLGKGGERTIEIYHVAERANQFFAGRRAANARLSALHSEPNGVHDVFQYARQLFDDVSLQSDDVPRIVR